jgi:hypothetical protein
MTENLEPLAKELKLSLAKVKFLLLQDVKNSFNMFNVFFQCVRINHNIVKINVHPA